MNVKKLFVVTETVKVTTVQIMKAGDAVQAMEMAAPLFSKLGPGQFHTDRTVDVKEGT